MKVVKKILTYIMAIIVTVLIVIYLIINLLSSTIMDRNYVFAQFEKNNYYEKVYNLVDSNFEKYIQQSGLNEDVIKNIVTKEKIEQDTKKILTNLYDGIEEEISTQDIADSLNEKINDSLNGRILTTSEKEAIAKFTQKICDEYKTTILHTSYEKNINTSYTQISAILKKVTKIATVALGIIVIIMIIINVKRIYKAANGIGISLTASGLILLATNIFIHTKIEIEAIAILNEPFSETLRSILNEIINNIYVYGMGLTIAGVLLIIGSNLIHNIKKYGLKTKEQD